MLRKHVRSPEPMVRGQFHHIECRCGWRGKVPAQRRGRRLGPDDLAKSAETLWLSHVPPRERRVYLLLDTRPPKNFVPLEEIKDQLRDAKLEAAEAINDQLLDLQARAEFKEQRQIVGNFLMPEGSPVHLLKVIERDGRDWGRFRTKADGPIEELPVGEIRTPDGKVWCAE